MTAIHLSSGAGAVPYYSPKETPLSPHTIERLIHMRDSLATELAANADSDIIEELKNAIRAFLNEFPEQKDKIEKMYFGDALKNP